MQRTQERNSFRINTIIFKVHYRGGGFFGAILQHISKLAEVIENTVRWQRISGIKPQYYLII